MRGWVSFYTLGLPRKARLARRAELDSDQWEQAHADGLHVSRARPGASSGVLLRCIRGVPEDLLCRLAEARSGDDSTEGRDAMQTLTVQSPMGRATMILMAVLIVAALGFNVVDNIEHYNSVEIINQSVQDVLGYSLLAVGLVLTAAGFA